ncbi:MAG: hypothetical protein LBV74_00385 [Tannerella sp.]|jgi:3-hydroxyacyl-[acyl-carrier-protein] dehydratase|nr:hypothetical protein [Tannerella sp.]
MLKGEFFTIKEVADMDNGRTYRLGLNASHPIFLAHFAGNPVMPGACIVQMIKELSSDYFGMAFFTAAVKNMKFLQVINPLESPEISVQLTYTKQEDDRIFVSAVLNNDNIIYSKSSLILENIKD